VACCGSHHHHGIGCRCADLRHRHQGDRADDLYRAQATVTGQGEANRRVGFAACLEDVLIKVSGAPRLAGDPRLAAYKSRAGDFVNAHSYRDQMSGTPTRDEQGTRDRPYDLTVDFDKTKIDDLLGSLGVKPWLSQRPVLSVVVAMDQGARNTSSHRCRAGAGATRGAARRSRQAGMRIVLPGEADLAKSVSLLRILEAAVLGIGRARRRAGAKSP